jgi:alpha-1,6-mannosyltransferase
VRVRVRDPYAWFAAAVGMLLVPVALRLPWGGDLGVHAATLERLESSLTDPGNPMVRADTASPYDSPWTVLLASVGLTAGLGPFALLRIAALTGLAAVLTGVWRFARALSGARWAPVLLFLCLVLLWGPRLFVWSGFLPLASMGLTLAYPSTLAWGLTLHLWALLPDTARREWPLARSAGIGLLAGTVLLVHQFTGAVLATGALAFAVSGVGANRAWRRAAIGWAVAGAVSATVVLAWPYYDFLRLADGSGGEDSIHRALFRHPVLRYGLAGLGVPALWLRFRRRRLDPLVLLFALCAGVLLAGKAGQHWALGRMLPGAAFTLQAALAIELAEWRHGPCWFRRVVTPLAGVALAVGGWAQAMTVSLAADGGPALAARAGAQTVPVADGYGWVTRWVRPGDVVMTDDYRAMRRLPAYGGYLVFCPYPDPFLTDWQARGRAMRSFFRDGAPRARRDAELARYDATWIIAKRGDERLPYRRVASRNGALLYRG